MYIFGIVLAATWYVLLLLWCYRYGKYIENSDIGLLKNGRNSGLDLHDRALPQLREQAATNPRLAALLDEVERGRQRQRDDE